MQGPNQRAYDRGSTIFSPDGRLYQVEYAREAVKRGSPTVGVRTDDGVVLAAATRRRSPLQVAGSIEKLHRVDDAIAVGAAGHAADTRRLVTFARERAQLDRLRYGEPIGVEALTTAVADHVQEATQQAGTRPYGVALLVGGTAPHGDPALFEVDPSGAPSQWHATAVGEHDDTLRDVLADHAVDPLGLDDAVGVALEALAAGTDELDPHGTDVLTVDESGIDTMRTDEIASVIDDRAAS